MMNWFASVPMSMTANGKRIRFTESINIELLPKNNSIIIDNTYDRTQNLIGCNVTKFFKTEKIVDFE